MPELENDALCVVMNDIVTARTMDSGDAQPPRPLEEIIKQFGRIGTEISENLQHVFTRYAAHSPVLAVVPVSNYHAFKESCHRHGGLVLDC